MKKFLLQKLEQIEDYASHPDPDCEVFESLRALIREIELQATKLGQPEIVQVCQIKNPIIGVKAARYLISCCLACLTDGPLTVQEAAERMGVSVRKVYQLCTDGHLRHSKNPIRIQPADLVKYQQTTVEDTNSILNHLP